MNHLPHARVLASAGTGKTHRLSSRYLDLVLRGADPRTLLATTFTRAAAAEIRERVLVRFRADPVLWHERYLLAEQDSDVESDGKTYQVFTVLTPDREVKDFAWLGHCTRNHKTLRKWVSGTTTVGNVV